MIVDEQIATPRRYSAPNTDGELDETLLKRAHAMLTSRPMMWSLRPFTFAVGEVGPLPGGPAASLHPMRILVRPEHSGVLLADRYATPPSAHGPPARRVQKD